MKLVKKELLGLPIKPCAPCEDLRKDVKFWLTAERFNNLKEPVLVVNLFHAGTQRNNRLLYCRIFCTKERWINWTAESGKWGKGTIEHQFGEWGGKSRCRRIISSTDEESAQAGSSFFQNGKENTLDAVMEFQDCMKYRKKLVEDEKREVKLARILEEFPPLPSEEVEREVLEGPLYGSRYLFYRRHLRKNPLSGISEPVYLGYCTHCCRTSELAGEVKHKTAGICPSCGSVVELRAEGIGRSRLRDECNYFVFGNGNMGRVYGWYLHITRDYSGDFRAVNTKIEEQERYCFDEGGVFKLVQTKRFRSSRWYLEWNIQKKTSEPNAGGTYTIHPFPDNFFDDTVLRHAHFADFLTAEAQEQTKEERYRIGFRDTPIEYLKLYLKHPNVEHLLSGGFYRLLKDYLFRSVRGAINWKAKRPREMLGLSRPELEQFARSKDQTCKNLIWMRRLRESFGGTIGEEEIGITSCICSCNEGWLEEWMRAGTAGTYLRYLRRQLRRRGQEITASSVNRFLTDLRDYYRECERLNYRLDIPEIRFPQDLSKAHQKTMELVRQQEQIEAYLRAEEERRAFAARLELLNRFEYADQEKGLMIRAARSRQELVDEGAYLHHCVGGYANSHIAGNTAIFFIRRIENPEVPWFTLEYRDGKIQQNRGMRNCATPKVVEQFAKQWVDKVARPVEKQIERERKEREARSRVRIA